MQDASSPSLSLTQRMHLVEAVARGFRLLMLDNAWSTALAASHRDRESLESLKSRIDRVMVKLVDDSRWLTSTIEAMERGSAPEHTLTNQLRSAVNNELDSGEAEVVLSALTASNDSLSATAGSIARSLQHSLPDARMTLEDEFALIRQHDRANDLTRDVDDWPPIINLPRPFMCAFADFMMLAGGVMLFIPPYLHGVAATGVGATIHKAKGC